MQKKQLVYLKTDFKTFTDFCDFYTRKISSMYSEAERLNLRLASKKDLVNNECLLLERIVQDNSRPRFRSKHFAEPNALEPVELDVRVTPICNQVYNIDIYVITNLKDLVKQYFDQVKESIPMSRKEGFIEETSGISNIYLPPTGNTNSITFHRLNKEMMYKLAEVTDEVLLKKEEEQEA